MRRIAALSMVVAVLGLTVGCGKKDSTTGSGGPTGAPSVSIEGTYLMVGMEAGGQDISEFVKQGPEAERTVKITATQFIGSKKGKEDPTTYKLDTSKTPYEIDMTGKKMDKKGAEKEEKMYGIVKVDGDKLLLCMTESDKSADRPKDFKTVKDGKAVLLTLEKKK